MAITKRCIRCRKKVREDGTCQNQNCVLYVPDKPKEEPKQETPSDDTTTPTTGGNE